MASRPDLLSPSLRYAPAMPPRTLALSTLLDAILASPVDKDELLEVVRVCGRGQLQGLIQHAAWQQERPDDNDLRTAREVSLDTGASLWSVKRAIRTGELPSRPPYPGAKRNLKVRRGDAREWAGKGGLAN